MVRRSRGGAIATNGQDAKLREQVDHERSAPSAPAASAPRSQSCAKRHQRTHRDRSWLLLPKRAPATQVCLPQLVITTVATSSLYGLPSLNEGAAFAI